MRALSDEQHILEDTITSSEDRTEAHRLPEAFFSCKVTVNCLNHHVDVLFTWNHLMTADPFVIRVKLEPDLHAHAKDGTFYCYVRICHIHHIFFNTAAESSSDRLLSLLAEPVIHFLQLFLHVSRYLLRIIWLDPCIGFRPLHHFAIIPLIQTDSLFLCDFRDKGCPVLSAQLPLWLRSDDTSEWQCVRGNASQWLCVFSVDTGLFGDAGK
mmetsp:Transcript_84515/g.146660  ORF Transcript_84515/g.146660 Transcript_84515/m.146660 type:complete len:211 (-) Transcript_84515:667-1299(-)